MLLKPVSAPIQHVSTVTNQGKVVIFNSDLFHETGKIGSQTSYENRRINITMLFGKRGE